LSPDVPTTFFEVSSTDLSTPANTSLWLTGNSGVSPGHITEVLGPDARSLFFCLFVVEHYHGNTVFNH
jgi:hypothetical protein